MLRLACVQAFSVSTHILKLLEHEHPDTGVSTSVHPKKGTSDVCTKSVDTITWGMLSENMTRIDD